MEYPRMIYGKGGATRTVASPEDEKALGKEWSRSPSDEHRVGAVNPIPQSISSNAPLTEAHIPIIADFVVQRLQNMPRPPAAEEGV